jgi:hypothetical protein
MGVRQRHALDLVKSTDVRRTRSAVPRMFPTPAARFLSRFASIRRNADAIAID